MKYTLRNWKLFAMTFIVGTLCLCVSQASAAIPKKGLVAIIVGGDDEHYIESVQSILIGELRTNGYKVVDEKKLAAERKSQVTRLALQGDVKAILKLGSKYGASVVITARVRAGEPVMNEFELMTGTASITVRARSGSNEIYGETFSAKQVGYTPEEAVQKSVDAAALLAARKLVE
jgi:hypothetical protein